MDGRILMDVLLAQEQALILPAFDETVAHDLGSAIFADAAACRARVVVDIRSASRRLFFAALPGSTPDNEDWARRKGNVVLRFHASSLRIGLKLEGEKRSAWPDAGLHPKEYAVHGGGFPVTVRDSGMVASIAVSGLPSRDDHELITAVLARRLNVPPITLKGLAH